MIRSILLAVWVSVITVAANAAYVWVQRHRDAPAETESKSAREVRKLKEISVPTIRDGVIKGYIVIKLNYVVDAAKAASAGISPDAFVMDEAFTYLYADSKIDYNRLERYDIASFKAAVLSKTNERLHAPVVTDVAVQEFTFMRPTENRRQP